VPGTRAASAPTPAIELLTMAGRFQAYTHAQRP
jgi:hypothetical protein